MPFTFVFRTADIYVSAKENLEISAARYTKYECHNKKKIVLLISTWESRKNYDLTKKRRLSGQGGATKQKYHHLDHHGYPRRLLL